MDSPSEVLLFAAFLRDFASAWRVLAAYPPGHPTAVGALARACDSLAALLAATGPLELAAARDGLLRGGERFDSQTAARFAERLRRRGAAAVLLEPGCESAEVERFLRALALDPRKARASGSLAAELAAAGLVHIRVRDLDFSDLALVDREADPTAPEAGALWDRLVRRVLEAGGFDGGQLATWIAAGRSPTDLLRLLLAGDGAAGLAGGRTPSLAAGLRAAAADYLERPGAPRAAALATLYGQLDAEAGARLVQELARGLRLHEDAERALAPLIAALSEEGATRLRRAHAEAAGAGTETGAAVALDRDRLARLRRAFAAADVDTFLAERPADRALEVLLELPEGTLRPALSAAAAEIARELQPAALDRANALALLELAEREEVDAERLPALLDRLEAGFRQLLESARLRQATDLVERVQRRGRGATDAAPAFRECAERLAGPGSIAALAATLHELSEESQALARALIERLGPTAVRHLLDQLAGTEDRAQRHRLLTLLASLGPLVVRDATHLLADARWYVVRNMLLLLRRVGDPGSVPAVRRCAEHPDLRVRLEAIRNLFAFDQELPRELLRKTFHHPDLRLAEAAVELAGEHAMAEAAEPLADLLTSWDPFGARRSLRLKALRALGALGEPRVLDRLRHLAHRFALPPTAREERIAFYRSLAGYPVEARRRFVERGLRSGVREIRRLARELAAADSEGP